MDFKKMYQDKLTTAEKAAKLVKSGDWVDYGMCAMQPRALDAALAARHAELEDVNVRGLVELWTPEVLKIPADQNPFYYNTQHMGGPVRKLVEEGHAFYIPIRFSETPRYYRENRPPVDVAMIQVSPMDQHGYMSLGPSASHLVAMLERAKIIVLEVNKNAPRCHGGHEAFVHVSQAHYIVEHDSAMAELPSGPISDIDNAVARLIVEEIPNHACIQLGIGGMPNAVGSLIAQSDLKDLGCHSEMYVDAFTELSLAGKITGKYKNIDRFRQCYSFAAGTQKTYDFMNDNPELMSCAIDYVNDVRVISSIDNMMSINNCVEIDLYGQVASESAGIRPISGAGGQLDFVLGAYLSKGGKSFICLASTMKKKDGTLASRIRPTLPNGSVVTDTRSNVQWIVTEYGKVNLKGLSTWQRAEALISIAHPDFQDELVKEAEKMYIWRKVNKKK